MTSNDNIKLDRIDVPDKYRREKSDDLTREQALLTRSIKTVGLRFPITVKENGRRYTLVDGVRRFNAFRSTRSETIACRIIPEDDRRDVDVLRFQMNFHRENLKPMDEARLFRQMIAEGWKKQELADAVGRKSNTLSRYFDCLRINAKWQHLVNDRTITLTDVQPVAALSPSGQKYLYSQIKSRELPFNRATISSMTRAMDPVKHPEWFNLPKSVATHRINERHGHPFAMKKVESVARMQVVTAERQRLIEKWEEEITLAIPIIKKVMSIPEVWEELPPGAQNAFKEFATEYIT